MSNLRLSYVVDSSSPAAPITPGSNAGKFYAMLFDNSGVTALKKVSVSPDGWELTEFVHSHQSSFSIPMEETSAGRSFFFTVNLDGSQFSMPYSELPYSVEYWRRDNTGANQDRDNDELLSSDDLFWNGEDRVPIIFPQSETLRISPVEAVAQVAYESVSNLLTVICFLSVGGQVSESTDYASVHLFKSSGESVAAQSKSTGIPGIPGVFKFDIQPVVLTADSISVMKVSLKLSGVDYESVVPVVVYD